MSQTDLTVDLNLIGSTDLCKIFLKQNALARNCLKYRGNVCHISNKDRIIRHKTIPNNTHLEEISFKLCNVHTADILCSLHICLELFSVQISNHLLLISTAKQNHVTEVSTVISHFTEKLIQKCFGKCNITRRNGSTRIRSTKFKHTTGFICYISTRRYLISTTKEGIFHITGNLNQLLLNLPSLFVSRVCRLSSSIQTGHSAGITLLCVSKINHFLMNLNNILFLLSCNMACSGCSCGSLFRNGRLSGFREVIKNSSREFKIVGLSAARQTTNHRKKRGLSRISSKKFARIVGQIPSSTNTCYLWHIISPYLTFLCFSKIVYIRTTPSAAASCLILITSN